MESATHDQMPAGNYYIGDLCYVMHAEWDEFCALTIKDQECLHGVFTLKSGVRFATYGTSWGDGLYTDQHGLEYSVDAGLIGCILVSDIDTSNPENDLEGGQIHEFTKPFHTGSTDGVIRFGNAWDGYVKIDTDPPQEDEEEDDFEYDEEE